MKNPIIVCALPGTYTPFGSEYSDLKVAVMTAKAVVEKQVPYNVSDLIIVPLSSEARDTLSAAKLRFTIVYPEAELVQTLFNSIFTWINMSNNFGEDEQDQFIFNNKQALNYLITHLNGTFYYGEHKICVGKGCKDLTKLVEYVYPMLVEFIADDDDFYDNNQ